MFLKFICAFSKTRLIILQPEWLKTFWVITQELELTQTWELYRHKANNMNCHLTLILGKMTEFFKKLIKPYIDHFQSILTTILGGGEGGGYPDGKASVTSYENDA